MKSFLCWCISACILQVTLAQSPSYNKFEWDPKPAMHAVDKKFIEDAAVFVVEKKVVEYVLDKEGLFMYKTEHRIVHINNDRGIESFNRVYLPFNEGLEMMDVKARTILPNGKIIEFDKNNIKDYKDDDGNEYRIFALEGLEKGCEIEYYYTQKKYPDFFGREVFSYRIPVINAEFELIAPDHLVFECKCYNKFPDGKDTVIGEKRYIHVTDNNIAATEDEKYTMYQANLKRVEYKLCYNSSKNAKARLFTWNELAKKAFDIYSTATDKEIKKVDDLLSDIGVTKSQQEKDKIILIENYLKKNFVPREDAVSADADDLAKVIKNKVTSRKGYSRLFCVLFNRADINYQVVLVGNRENYGIDRNFENWDNAANLLLYFPVQKKFLAPTEIEMRYPWIPPNWAATNGLFCKVTTIGDFKTAVAEIRPVALEEYEKSFLNMNISLEFNKATDSLLMNLRYSYGGYAAPNYKAPFVFMPQEEQSKFLKELLQFGTNSENVTSSSFENKELEQSDPYKPFVINATVKSAGLLEKAGGKIILKIGEMIGEQVEMYDEKPRQNPVELPFPHSLERNIEFTIPDGYVIKNLDDLSINHVYTENGNVVMGFVSRFTREGNKIRVAIREDYRNVSYPLEQYENFKKVINASADFNKVVLILEKN